MLTTGFRPMNNHLIMIDTEFTDFIDTELISLGAVTLDGEEFYVEITDYNTKAQSDFVKQIVVPLLDHQQHGHPRITASRMLNSWIQSLPGNGKDYIVVVDYSKDFELFNSLRSDTFVELYDHLLSSININTLLVNDTIAINNDHALPVFAHGLMHICFDDYYQYIDNRQHHALVDAKSNLYGYNAAIEYLKNKR